MRTFLTRFALAGASTALLLSACGGYGGGNNYMAPSNGVTCGGGAYSSPCPAPTVAVTAPAADATVSGKSVTLSASASATDGLKISSVEFFVSGKSVAMVMSSPYNFTWDSTTVVNGDYQVTAKVTDDLTGAVTATVGAGQGLE